MSWATLVLGESFFVYRQKALQAQECDSPSYHLVTHSLSGPSAKLSTEGFWQIHYTSFYSQRLLISKRVLCLKSGIYWLAVRWSWAHRGLGWGIHDGIRTVKHWNWSPPFLGALAVAVASSFSKLLILLLAHLEALLPLGKSNSTVCATRPVAGDQWHSWDRMGSDPHVCESRDWAPLQSEEHT